MYPARYFDAAETTQSKDTEKADEINETAMVENNTVVETNTNECPSTPKRVCTSSEGATTTTTTSTAKTQHQPNNATTPTVASTSTSANNTTNVIELTQKHCSFRRDPSKYHLIIGVTGSVAAIKLPDLISELRSQCGTDRLLIRVVCTRAAMHFVARTAPVPNEILMYVDEHEWQMWQTRGDNVLHIELRRWADALLIAPLDANTMGKMANGLCDNLLTSLIRAWEPSKPLYFAPAMNTYMWEHPLTYKHLEILKGLLQYREIPAIEKELVCGDKGYGAMAEVRMIASVVNSDVKNRFSVVSFS